MSIPNQSPITPAGVAGKVAPARHRLRVAIGFAVVCVLIAGCGSAWWPHSGSTSCGLPAWVRLGGRVMEGGRLHGLVPGSGTGGELTVGQTIDVHMAQEPGGTSGNTLVMVSPLPQVGRIGGA